MQMLERMHKLSDTHSKLINRLKSNLNLSLFVVTTENESMLPVNKEVSLDVRNT